MHKTLNIAACLEKSFTVIEQTDKVNIFRDYIQLSYT